MRKYKIRGDSAKPPQRNDVKGDTRAVTSPATKLQDSPDDRRSLSVFHNISKFNEARLESVLALEDGVPRSSLAFNPMGTFYPVDSLEVYGLFSLATALYRRDLGRLAGKAIRKAFIVVESALQNLDVHFLWEFIDIMYGMIIRGQRGLLAMFLAHVAALSYRLLPPTHPVTEAFTQLAQHSDEDKAVMIGQARRCSYDSVQRWLDPWCGIVDALNTRGDMGIEYNSSNASNFLVVSGVASHVVDREAAGRYDPASQMKPDAAAVEAEFRQMRMKYNTAIDVIDLLGPAKLTKNELLMAPFSIHERLKFKASGLALKGRVYQHLANRRFGEARILNDQMRAITALLAGTDAYSSLKYLQHLCTVEDRLYQAGEVEYAHEIGADILVVADNYLADISDHTG